MGLHGGEHGFRILSEVNSLGYLSEVEAASSLVKLWHGVLVALWQVRSRLKVGGTHLGSECFGVVGSAWSLVLTARRWVDAVLGLLHLDSLHIVLVATSFQQDTSLGEFVLESVSVVI